MSDRKKELAGRMRIYRIGRGKLLDLFCVWEPGRMFVTVPKIKGIPDGAIVAEVHENYAYAAFDFVVLHESFEKVEAFEKIPVVPMEWETFRIALGESTCSTKAELSKAESLVPLREGMVKKGGFKPSASHPKTYRGPKRTR